MKILVIENEELLAENLCQYLKKIENLKIEYVTSAQKTLQLLSQQRYDLIITDLWLPDSKSDEWLLKVGKINPIQNLIIMSSYTIPPTISSSENLNIIGYFEKPFDMKELANNISRLMAESKGLNMNH